MRKRFPQWSDVLSVFGVAVFVCFGWSLLGFFNKLSSFLLYFTPAEIGYVFAFMMAFALLESLALTGILALLGALLPAGWLKDGFAIKGFVILIIATTTSILFQKSLWLDYPPTGMLVLFAIVPLAVMITLMYLLRFVPKVQNVIRDIQDRILMLLFIYIPIGVVGLIVFLYKNLV